MNHPLQTTPEEMRRQGYLAVDALLEALAAERPIVIEESPATMRTRIDSPPPADGRPFDQALAELLSHVDSRAISGARGYLGHIPGYANWPSALADLIASGLNIDACWWAGAAGPTQLELTVLGWFADWLGYSHDADGILVSGGSAASLTALGCAREIRTGGMPSAAAIVDRGVGYRGQIDEPRTAARNHRAASGQLNRQERSSPYRRNRST